MRNVITALLLIGLAMPMLLKKVPRNSFYGFRTGYTVSSDEVWYRANQIAGIALAAVGLFWLLLVFVPPTAAIYSWISLIRRSALAIGVAVAFWLTYRHRDV